ncbi:hypothetical protein LTR08_005724 [Meristemomyces frigidus]|nr:hypothetical protein LTR08_005724 [Meristemomyces frigidus]
MNGKATRTPTALGRWSCQPSKLPPVDQIKSIHVYDFDNTLFGSPLPNKSIWNMTTFGQLQAQDFLHNGGWWHNAGILGATGRGLEVEEGRAWEGFWNERIVELVRLSVADDQTLTVLLTGRSESAFSELVGKMVASKGLKFDMVCLKPKVSPSGELFSTTMAFKQLLLRDLVFTYTTADEIRVYEDRPKHTKGFRDFFSDLNRALLAQASHPDRHPITAEVIQVTEAEITMDPVSEVAQVQQMLNVHNQAILAHTAPPYAIPYKIKRSVFYTGYILPQPDIDRLKTLVKLPPNCPEHEVRWLANNILITPRPAPRSILDKVGGLGAKIRWRVTGLSCLETKLWAARVEPTAPGTRIYTENTTPCIVLATRRTAKPIDAARITNWQPVAAHQAFELETTVGEKVLLRIEEEVRGEDSYEASFPNQRNARKHPREEEFAPLGRPRPQQRAVYGQLQQGSGAWAGKAGRGGGEGRDFSSSSRGGHGNGNGNANGNGNGNDTTSGVQSGVPPRGNAARGNRGGNRGNHAQRRGGHGNAGGRGGGGGRGRGSYRSLDDNVGQGYGGGGMQY